MARWKDLAPRQESTSNQGGSMVEVRGVVLHIAEGSYEGTISWQKNATSDVSSHFIKGKNDGEDCQMVDTATAAWTQKAGNGHWLSIENAGSVPDKLTASQVEFAAQILARAHEVYKVPLQVTSDPDGKGLGHHSMGSHPGYADDWGHSQCPGSNIINQKSAIVARAKEIVNGGTTVDLEDVQDIWQKDNGIDSDAYYWRADSPGHTPPGTNAGYMAQTGLAEAAQQAHLALLSAQRCEAALAEIKTMLTAGVVVSPIVKVDPESVAAIADATADEIHADPERDGA